MSAIPGGIERVHPRDALDASRERSPTFFYFGGRRASGAGPPRNSTPMRGRDVGGMRMQNVRMRWKETNDSMSTSLTSRTRFGLCCGRPFEVVRSPEHMGVPNGALFATLTTVRTFGDTNAHSFATPSPGVT